ncbi:MAG: family transcriptional regulator [Firmicutes bacterium]|nr:family transcriptional regulator [Bacillota bacterium]
MKRNWLEEILRKKKLTHQHAANIIGIERSYFTQIVGGKRRPSPDVAQKIGQALGFDWTIFFKQECGVTPQILSRSNNPYPAA